LEVLQQRIDSDLAELRRATAHLSRPLQPPVSGNKPGGRLSGLPLRKIDQQSVAHIRGLMIDYLNDLRAAVAIQPLREDLAIDGYAEKRAERNAILQQLTHDGFVPVLQKIGTRCRERPWSGGENMAFGLRWLDVLQAWGKSKEHRENLLMPKWSRVGIGLALDGKGTPWVVALFFSRC
jgi:uncharacterized protein YkwD